MIKLTKEQKIKNLASTAEELTKLDTSKRLEAKGYLKCLQDIDVTLSEMLKKKPIESQHKKKTAQSG